MNFDERLVLMITSKDGSRFINVSIFFRQLSLYVLLFFLSSMFFIAISLGVFRAEIKNIDEKTSLIKERNETMLLGNAALYEEINQRMEEITIASDKVGSLEEQIGVNNVPNEELLERINVASITGAQKAFFMKFIPNGNPLGNNFFGLAGAFGPRFHPLIGEWKQHTGLDLAAPIGTSVYATADGVVDFADSGYNGGYGKLVKITHSFGFKTYYAHLSSVLIEAGTFVKKGQLIAKSGNTGVSTGPHLHYEVRFLDNPIQPMNFVQWDMKNFDFIFTKERSIEWQSLLATINNLME